MKGWTVDRFNPADPEYAPGKCHWAPKPVQTRNRRNTVLIVNAKGTARTPEEWEKHSKRKLKADTLRKRKRRGWTDAEILAGRRELPSIFVAVTPVPADLASAKRTPEENKGEFESAWRTTMTDLYPDETHVLTRKERGMLDAMRAFFVESGFGYLHYPEDVLQHALRNWPAIMRLAKRDGVHKPPEFPNVGLLASHPRVAVNIYMSAHDLVQEGWGVLKPRPVQHDSHVWAFKPHLRKLERARRELEAAERLEAANRPFEAFKQEVMSNIESSPEAINNHELAHYAVSTYEDAAYACKALEMQIDFHCVSREQLFVLERQLDYWRSRLPSENSNKVEVEPKNESPFVTFRRRMLSAVQRRAADPAQENQSANPRDERDAEPFPELGTDEFLAIVAAIKVTGEDD